MEISEFLGQLLVDDDDDNKKFQLNLSFNGCSMVVGVAPWLLVLLHGCWCCSMIVGVAARLLVLEKAIGHM